MNELSVEMLIIKNLIENREYFLKVIPHIIPEYFEEESYREIFRKIRDYSDKYQNSPTIEAILIEFSTGKCREDVYNGAVEILKNISKTDNKVELQWLLDKTEKFCQDRALYLAISKSVDIMSGQEKKLSKGAIPQIITDALSVCFNNNLGYEVLEDYEERYEEELKESAKYPIDIKVINEIMKGGPLSGTLNVILAGVHVGKTMTLCHVSSCYLRNAKNVLYISLEMSEEEITKRVFANALNISIDELDYIKKNNKEKYFHKMKMLKDNCKGRFIVKRYPTSTASVIDFEAYLQELKLKKRFVPEVIVIDYINIAVSSKLKMNANINTYERIKSIAEELRAFAVIHDVPIWSATQLNRGGLTKSDVDMTDTAESFGLPQTVDFMMAMTTDDDLRQQGRIAVKQLKNRYNDMYKKSRFLLGVDYARMKLYDVDDDTRVLSNNTNNIKSDTNKDSKFSKFKTLKF